MPAGPALVLENWPEETLARLHARAERNHRSLEGELVAIVEQATQADAAPTPGQVWREAAAALGGVQPDQAAALIRADRDRGHDRR